MQDTVKWLETVIKTGTSKYTELQVQFLNPLNIPSLFPWRWDTVDNKPHFRYTSRTKFSRTSYPPGAQLLLRTIHPQIWFCSQTFGRNMSACSSTCALDFATWRGGNIEDLGQREWRRKGYYWLRCQVKLSVLGWALQWPVHLVRVQTFVQPFD